MKKKEIVYMMFKGFVLFLVEKTTNGNKNKKKDNKKKTSETNLFAAIH